MLDFRVEMQNNEDDRYRVNADGRSLITPGKQNVQFRTREKQNEEYQNSTTRIGTNRACLRLAAAARAA